MNLLTFNLRIDLASDGIHRWDNRLPAIATFLNGGDHPLVCAQEPNSRMIADLLSACPKYRTVGKPRDARGEATPIFYDPSRCRLVSDETIWLSATPFAESSFPDSCFPRIATIAVFDAGSDGTFRVANTHLDYAGEAVRLRQAAVLLSRLGELHDERPLPLFVVGDFNALPGEPVHALLAAERVLGLKSVYGDAPPTSTFHAFGRQEAASVIDFIYYRGAEPVSWRVVSTRPGDVMLSDHDPVEAVFRLSG